MSEVTRVRVDLGEIGPQGPAGTITIGDVTITVPSVIPSIVNVGTGQNAVLDWTLPRAPEVTVGTVSTVDADQSPDVTADVTDGDVALDFDLPQAKGLVLGDVTVVDPVALPSITDVGDANEAEFDFDLPRARDVTFGAVTVVTPDTPPDASTSQDAAGDVTLDLDLPRAPTFAVGDVDAVAFEAGSSVTDVGTDGDIVLDFLLERGANGWSPVLAVVADGTRRVLQIADWVGGEGDKPATGEFVGPTGLVATAAEAVDIRGPEGPATLTTLGQIPDVDLDDLQDGEVLTYNDALGVWENQPVAAALGDLTDVDTTGAEDGQALVFAYGEWQPGDVALDIFANFDAGRADTIYGGVVTIDAGGA